MDHLHSPDLLDTAHAAHEGEAPVPAVFIPTRGPIAEGVWVIYYDYHYSRERLAVVERYVGKTDSSWGHRATYTLKTWPLGETIQRTENGVRTAREADCAAIRAVEEAEWARVWADAQASQAPPVAQTTPTPPPQETAKPAVAHAASETEDPLSSVSEADKAIEAPLATSPSPVGVEGPGPPPADPSLLALGTIDGIARSSESTFRGRFLTGAAGTGKSYTVNEEVAKSPARYVMAATTGIAAVNLGAGVTTIHSLLGFHDYTSLGNAFLRGSLQRKLAQLAAKGIKWVVIDEVSMLSAATLDLLIQGVLASGERADAEGRPPVGLWLTGDFLQLPPIGDEDKNAVPPLTREGVPSRRKKKVLLPGTDLFAFQSDNWEKFFGGDRTTKLEKVWRQSDPNFLAALNSARAGNGAHCDYYLRHTGCEFARDVDLQFDGTTIFAKNAEVDRFNGMRLAQLPGQPEYVHPRSWTLGGQPNHEWKRIEGEPFAWKVGALVMILDNDRPSFRWANGDLATVLGYDEGMDAFAVRLKRNGKEEWIGRVQKRWEVPDPPEGIDKKSIPRYSKDQLETGQVPWNTLYYNKSTERYVVGAIEYHPLRLAWGSTVHKSQGLTMDLVQIDPRDQFFGMPAMLYVALSRARAPEGMRLVVGGDGGAAASARVLGEKARLDVRCMRWV